MPAPLDFTLPAASAAPLSEAELAAVGENLKRELLELRRQKAEFYKTRRLWCWSPSPKQLEFFKRSKHLRRAGFCGNRFGKSMLGVVEDICWLIGFRPFFEEGHPLRYAGIPRHGVKGLLIAEEWDKVKEIFTNNEGEDRQGKFWEFLPAGCDKAEKEGQFEVSFKKNEKGIITQINVVSIVDGQRRSSAIYFDTVKSYKSAPASFESSDWDFIHLDEPVMKDLWTAISRGLVDRNGSSWWLLTPIKEVWMFNEMVDNAKKQPDVFWWFEATMDDNPTLSEQAKELYLNDLPEDQRKARREGKPLAHGRLVFSDYDPVIHNFDGVKSDWPEVSRPPFKDYMVAYALDTHTQTPQAGLFVAIHKSGDVDIYDEIWEKGRIRDLAGTVKHKIQGLHVGYGLCEPAAWNEDQGSGFCYADIFLEEGLDLIPGSKRKDDAIMLTQQLLKQRKREIRIHQRCKRLRWELMNNYFDKDNKPEDKNDHVIECLRRLVIHDALTYYSPVYTGSGAQFSTEKELKVNQQHLDLRGINLTRI